MNKEIKVTDKNRIDYIIDYESGQLDDYSVLELFSHLIKTGMCWNLQGHYGRTGQNLIDGEIIFRDGTINWDLINERI